MLMIVRGRVPGDRALGALVGLGDRLGGLGLRARALALREERDACLLSDRLVLSRPLLECAHLQGWKTVLYFREIYIKI